ncbi:hypothetical protein HNP81_004367 [Peribacillus huizhouensis]|uniref:Uncharacterized protein n=1 Tax=Peribacillus huizhouensis TaxID=1501239 RepID=A0ABR6CVR0_9BACI|nr:hypothetical protein [Peribacillus huizhouensis]
MLSKKNVNLTSVNSRVFLNRLDKAAWRVSRRAVFRFASERLEIIYVDFFKTVLIYHKQPNS